MDSTQPQTGSRRKSSLAFPALPLTKRGNFISFLEESGAADAVFELFSKLYELKQKPENPLLWILNYLREAYPSRKYEIEASIEGIQHDIIQIAKEIEEMKERIRSSQIHQSLGKQGTLKSKGRGANEEEKSLGNNYKMDADFYLNDDGREWLIKPHPFYKPTFKLSTRNYEATSKYHPQNRIPHVFEKSEDILNDPEIPSNIDVHMRLTQQFQNMNAEIEDDGWMKNRSTETSPEPSNTSINKTSSFSKTIQQKTLEHSLDDETVVASSKSSVIAKPKFITNDPSYFARRIPKDFWKENYSFNEDMNEVDEFAGIDLDELSKERLQGKSYRFHVLDENSWLPERDLAMFENLSSTLIDGRLSKTSINNTGSKTNEVSSQSQHPFLTGSDPQSKRFSLEQYEWIQKEYGPTFLKPSKSELDKK